MRILAFPALLLGLVAHAQTAHLIRGLDHYFQPDTLVMVVGDSVRFQTQQMHNMLQVSEADWLLNFAIPNGGFQTVLGQDSTFAIDTAGTYHFVCEPHGFMGMKGVLLVAPNAPLGLADGPVEALRVHPNPARTDIHVHAPPEADRVEEVVVIDMLGRPHAVTHTRSFQRISCTVAALPRGPVVVMLYSGPRSWRAVVLLE